MLFIEFTLASGHRVNLLVQEFSLSINIARFLHEGRHLQRKFQESTCTEIIYLHCWLAITDRKSNTNERSVKKKVNKKNDKQPCGANRLHSGWFIFENKIDIPITPYDRVRTLFQKQISRTFPGLFKDPDWFLKGSKFHINPYTPKISMLILLTAFHTLHIF